MEAKRKVYTPGFELQAAQMVTEQRLSVAEATRRLGVHDGRPHEWREDHPKDGAVAFPGPGHQTPAEAELRRLRAEVRRLEVGRDIPKEATALLAALTKSPSPGPRSAATSTRWRRPAQAAGLCRGRPEEELLARVEEVHAEAKSRYGSPGVHTEFRGRGVDCCVNTVTKLMHASGIRAGTSRRSVRTTDSRHGPPVAANALGSGFTPAGPTGGGARTLRACRRSRGGCSWRS